MIAPLVCVVSTGRCGSTLLGRMLAQCPQVLVLSEFFACLSPFAFPEGEVSAIDYWRILATPRLKPNVLLRHGLGIEEFLYDRERAARDWSDGVPPLLLVALPFLTDRPEALFTRIEHEVCTWEAAAIGDHHARLFRWLLAEFDKSLVVERSGGSLRFVKPLSETFPGARFVHLTRHGYDSARSMSRHNSFRLEALTARIRPILGVDPFHDPARVGLERLPVQLRRILPETFEPEQVKSLKIDLAEFGTLWSAQVLRGVRDLAKIDPAGVLTVRYEDLVTAPAASLERIAAFCGLDAPDAWIDCARAMVDGRSGQALSGLTPEEIDALRQSCALGLRVLGYRDR